MFKAKCYTRINGITYTKGEFIPEDLPADKIAWLIKAGAIDETAPAAAEAVKEEVEEVLPEPEETEPEKTSEEPAAEPEEDAPEIDVMAGIIAEEKEEDKTAKKPAARKTTERRKGK